MPEESRGIDPYEAVLADLRAKRDQIDQAIAAIENLRSGIVPASGAASGGGAAQSASEGLMGPGALLGMSIVDGAKKLLAIKRQPLRNPEISALFKQHGLVLNSKDPVNTIGAVLTRRFEDVGDVVKVDRGTWGLKEWYPNRSFKREKPEFVAAGDAQAQPEPQKKGLLGNLKVPPPPPQVIPPPPGGRVAPPPPPWPLAPKKDSDFLS